MSPREYIEVVSRSEVSMKATHFDELVEMIAAAEDELDQDGCAGSAYSDLVQYVNNRPTLADALMASAQKPNRPAWPNRMPKGKPARGQAWGNLPGR